MAIIRNTAPPKTLGPQGAEPRMTAAAPIGDEGSYLTSMDSYHYTNGPLQRQADPGISQSTSARTAPVPPPAVTPRPNRTGLPDRLKAGVEQLSGIAMDDVKVHYNSPKPATLQALAYAQGTEIHVAPGQEEHVPHEAWHVVQQKQRRVQARFQMKPGARVNDDATLEREADVMGRRALNYGASAITQGVAAFTGQPGPSGNHGRHAPIGGQTDAQSLSISRPTDRGRPIPIAVAPGPAVVQRFDWLDALGLDPSTAAIATSLIALAGGGIAALYRRRPAGRSIADLTTLLRVAGLQNGLAFAYPAAWNSVSVIALAGNFAAAPNNLTAAQWVTVAGNLANNAVADTTTFCQLAGWNGASIAQLAADFAAQNPLNLTAAEWLAVAAQAGNNEVANTTAFCRGLPGWNGAGIAQLTGAFAAGHNNLSAAEWIAVAQHMPANAADDARDFCRLAGWQGNRIAQLAGYAIGDANGLTPAQWATVAGRMGQNAVNNTRDFCRLAGWSWDSINRLTTAFFTNPNNLNAAAWITVARRLLANSVDAARDFCRLANWDGPSIAQLAGAFSAGNNGLSYGRWLTVAARAGNNAHAEAAGFAQLAGWTWDVGINRLTTAFANGRNNLTAGQWVNIAGRMGNDANAAEFCQLANWTWVGINGLTAAFALNAQALSSSNWFEIAQRAAASRYADVVAFLQAVRANNAAAPALAISNYLAAGEANAPLVDLTALLQTTAANGTIVQLTTLLGRAIHYDAAATVADVDALLQAIQGQNAGTSVVDTTALINAVAARGTIAETTALVVSLAGHSTIAELTTLLNRVQNHRPGTLVPATDALVQSLGGVGNVCNELGAIVNAVRQHGTVPETTAMVTQAVLTLGAANVSDLIPLIDRNRAQNTPPRVLALLVAVTANVGAVNARVRYLRIHPKIAWFGRNNAAPNPAKRYYDAAGAYLGNAAAAGTFECAAWQHFYKRHSYEYYDFAQADVNNSMWPQGVNAVTELDGSLPTAIGNGLGPGGAIQNQNGGNNRVGTAGGGVIAQLVPIGGNVNEQFTLAESNAIRNLR